MPHPHRHTEIELFAMRGGAYTRKFAEELVAYSEDEILVYWGCIPHQLIQIPKSGRGFVAYFPLESFLQWHLPEVFVHEVLGGKCYRIPRTAEIDLAVEALMYWLPSSGKAGRRLPRPQQMIVEGSLGVIGEHALQEHPFTGGGGKNRGGKLHVSRMIEFAVRNRCEPLVVDEICAATGLHPTYGRTLFKKTVGISLHQFLTNHRLEHAKNLLANGEALIIDVALESGFGSVSRFHAIFKDKVGMTPRAFRKKTRIALA